MNTEHWNPFSGISNVLSDLKSGNIGSIYGDLMETAEQKRKKKIRLEIIEKDNELKKIEGELKKDSILAIEMWFKNQKSLQVT